MKKVLILLLMGCPMILALASCTHASQSATDNKSESSADSQEYYDDETSADDYAEENAETICLTCNSVGPVRIGMPISSLPESVEGLYDSYTIEDSGAYEGTYYKLNPDSSVGSEVISVLIAEDSEVITGISLPTATKIDAGIDGRKFYLPDITAGDLFSLLGAKAFHIYWMGLCIYVDDLTFFFAFDDLTPEGRAKVEADEYTELHLEADDFNPTAKPDYVLVGSTNFV